MEIPDMEKTTIMLSRITADTWRVVVVLIAAQVFALSATATEFAYVAQPTHNTVAVVDLSTNTIVATIPITDAFGLAVSPDGHTVYVSQPGPASVSAIDVATQSVVATIPVSLGPGPQPDYDIPFRLAITPDGLDAYVADFGRLSQRIYHIDLATNAVSAVTAGGRPHWVAITPNGALVYVTNENDGSVSVINSATQTKFVPNIPIGDGIARGIAINALATRAYVGSQNRLSVLDVTANAFVANKVVVNAAFAAVTVSPDGSRVYAVAINLGQVIVYDTTQPSAELTEVTRINVGVGAGTSDLLLMNANGSLVYVGSDSLPVIGGSGLAGIDTATNTVTVTIPVVEPRGLVVFPVDTTAPAVSCGSPDGLWHATDVQIACTASDSESGLADPGDANFDLAATLASGSESAHVSTNTRTVFDIAGNSTIAGPIGPNKIDKKAPTVTIIAPAGTVTLGQVVAANYACTDAGSGVATCTGPVTSGQPVNTSSVGSFAFDVTGTDAVGNSATAGSSYTVSYGICLLSDLGRAVKAGSSFSIWLQLCDATRQNRSSSALVLTVIGIVPGMPLSDVFRFVPERSAYHYVVSAAGLSPGTYWLQFMAGSDPTTHQVQFKVRP